MEHFKHAQPYIFIKTDHEERFQCVVDYLKNGTVATSPVDFIVQVVHFPNFNSHLKKIDHIHVTNAGISIIGSLAEGYFKVNAFKNYRTSKGVGHAKGMFYELNLYMNEQVGPHRKPSTATGNAYTRDNSHDL